jgi:hypothetical protein
MDGMQLVAWGRMNHSADVRAVLGAGLRGMVLLLIGRDGMGDDGSESSYMAPDTEYWTWRGRKDSYPPLDQPLKHLRGWKIIEFLLKPRNERRGLAEGEWGGWF